MIDEEEVHILTEFGLTMSQATVYLTLAKFKDATVKTLCKSTDIARQDIYQILNELQELGLVERILSKPLRFRATIIKNAVSILDSHRERKNFELHNKALVLFSRFEHRKRTRELDLCEPNFEVRNVYQNDPRVKNALRNANVKIRLLSKKVSWTILYSFVDDAMYALKKGVKIEIMTESATEGQIEPKFLNALKKTNSFQTRYIERVPTGNMLIFDNEEMAIWEEQEHSQLGKSASIKALWSNHHGLIKLANEYFELVWKISSSSEKSMSEEFSTKKGCR